MMTTTTEAERFTQFIVSTFKDCVSEGMKSVCMWGCGQEISPALDLLTRGGETSKTTVILVNNDKMKDTSISGHAIHTPEYLRQARVDALIVCTDEDKERALRTFCAFTDQMPQVYTHGVKNVRLTDPDYLAVTTPGGACIREHLFQVAKYVIKNNIPGDFIELGVGAGNTTCYLAAIFRHFGVKNRKIYAVDTFSGFPKRAHLLDLDLVNIEEHYKRPCSLEAVTERCKDVLDIVTLVKGDVAEALPRLAHLRFALSFHDMDNYTPTKNSLSFIYERTSTHGALAFDHFNIQGQGMTIGQRIAVKEFLDGNDKDLLLHGTNILIKFQ